MCDEVTLSTKSPLIHDKSFKSLVNTNLRNWLFIVKEAKGTQGLIFAVLYLKTRSYQAICKVIHHIYFIFTQFAEVINPT